MITVKMRKVCGCCYAYFHFEDLENLEQQMENAHKKITDDNGYSEYVDCFFGYTLV